MLGNGRLEAQCIDGVKRLCHIRGKMRKKVWVNTVSCPLHTINAGRRCMLNAGECLRHCFVATNVGRHHPRWPA